MSMIMGGCGDGAGGGTGPDVLVVADVPRLDTEAGASSEVVAASTEFATDLYRVLAATDGNLVFSPHSVAIALAMTRAGAAGATLDAFDRVLHLGGVVAPDAGFNALDRALASRSGTFTRADNSEAELTLRMANALWGQRQLTFEGPFLEQLARFYGAGMRLVDFAGDAPTARIEINEWVADATEDRIPDLIPEGALNELTRLVLTNAVYLLAPWEAPFAEGATGAATFTHLDGSVSEAELMQLNGRVAYAAGDQWQAVELPYAGRELAMLVIVPDEGSFQRIEDGLKAELVTAVTAALAVTRVRLRFPEFEFRTQAGLKRVLSDLGLADAFDPEVADFSGMTMEESLSIADVIHEAFIAVDEEGTEAAAATAVIMAARGMLPETPIDLTVDRPFLFVVRDVPTGAVLFLGRVVDPSA